MNIRQWVDQMSALRVRVGTVKEAQAEMGMMTPAANFRFAGKGGKTFTLDELMPQYKAACAAGWKHTMGASVPPEWESTVKGLKKHPEVDNPWALANWMDKEGYAPGGSEKK